MSGVWECTSMKLHPKIRKAVKWAGAAVTVLLVVAWVGSNWQYVGYVRGPRKIAIFPGRVLLLDTRMLDEPEPNGWHVEPQSRWYPWGWWFEKKQDRIATSVYVPIWALAAAAFGVTIAARHLDILARRRDRLGRCPKCNYDLTGLAAGAVCPECGRPPT